jgi:DNA-binding NarL/FixJ family response regulator
MISIAIADDHPMVIKGLQNMLHDFKQISIVDTYENGNELLQGLKKQQPDVLLLDIQMPGMQGDELAKIISEEYPGISILTLTNLDQPFHVEHMMHSGALGYLLKSTNADKLLDAIQTVAKGKQYIDPVMKEQILDEMYHVRKDKAAMGTPPKLSRREQELLQLIAKEFTSQEIADQWCVSLRTVENHRVNLLYKLGVKNSVGLVMKAMGMGML